MKRILLFVIPFVLAVMVFSGFIFWTSKEEGKGALQVTSKPFSKIYLDGKYIGDTPFPKNEKDQYFNVGEHTLKLVSLEGDYMPFSEKIKITKGILTVVDRIFGKGATSEGAIINLDPLSNNNQLELLVLSSPDQAKVLIDSSSSGITPLLIKNLTASDHEIKITKEGYKEKDIRVKTTLGYKLTLFTFLGINMETINVMPTPVASVSAVIEPPVLKVLILETPTGFLNVRSANSLSGAVIAKINPGENYELISEKDNWFEIKLRDNKTGWISNQYAKKQNP